MDTIPAAPSPRMKKDSIREPRTCHSRLICRPRKITIRERQGVGVLDSGKHGMQFQYPKTQKGPAGPLKRA